MYYIVHAKYMNCLSVPHVTLTRGYVGHVGAGSGKGMVTVS